MAAPKRAPKFNRRDTTPAPPYWTAVNTGKSRMPRQIACIVSADFKLEVLRTRKYFDFRSTIVTKPLRRPGLTTVSPSQSPYRRFESTVLGRSFTLTQAVNFPRVSGAMRRRPRRRCVRNSGASSRSQL